MERGIMIKKYSKKLAKDLHVYFWYLNSVKKIKSRRLIDIILNERDF